MYEISGKRYVIRPLVLGQLKQLSALLSGVAIPTEFTITDIIRLLGEKLPEFLAVILVEEGKKISEKNMEELVREIEENIDIDTGMKMVEDFFAITPIQSLLNRITETANNILRTEKTEQTG